MLELSQMVLRLIFAIVLGALIGLERETIGKEAGVRTGIVVSAGSAIFTMIAFALPEAMAAQGIGGGDPALAFNVIANIITGIGFLGAGIIIKNQEAAHVHGLTTAAAVWATAAIGILAGLGMFAFAFVSAALLAGILYLLRKTDFSHK
jgi:putative Mg2+ transporter-C (MgtC) family protein